MKLLSFLSFLLSKNHLTVIFIVTENQIKWCKYSFSHDDENMNVLCLIHIKCYLYVLNPVFTMYYIICAFPLSVITLRHASTMNIHHYIFWLVAYDIQFDIILQCMWILVIRNRIFKISFFLFEINRIEK